MNSSPQTFVPSLPLSPTSSSPCASRTPICPSKSAQSVRRRQVPRATIALPSPASNPAAMPPSSTPRPGEVYAVKTPQDLEDILDLAGEGVVVLDFMAAWCRKCIYLKPKFAKVAKEVPNAFYGIIDVNKVEKLPKQFAVRHMPTFVVLKNGKEVERFVGGGKGQVVFERILSGVRKHAVEN